MLTAVISNGEVGVTLVQFLHQNRVPVVFYSDIQDPGERAMSEAFCQSRQIRMHKAEHPSGLYDWLKHISPAVVFVCGYNHRIDTSLLSPALAGNIFNIHPGSLPAYRGPSPVFWQLKEGAKQIGTCIHRIAQHFDAGNIVWEKQIQREDHFTFTQLTGLTSYLAIEGVGMILQQIASGQPLREYPQDKSKARYHKRPTAADVTINWQHMRADEIVHLINACNGWNKGAATSINGTPCKIVDAYKLKLKPAPASIPGTITQLREEMWVVCPGNELLNITMVNLNGNFVPARFIEKYGIRKGNRFE